MTFLKRYGLHLVLGLLVVGIITMVVLSLQWKNNIKHLNAKVSSVSKEQNSYMHQKDSIDNIIVALTDSVGVLDSVIDYYESLDFQLETARSQYGKAIYALEEEILAGDNPTKIMYLTLDDGPYDRTHDFLDILDSCSIDATFFVLGKPKMKAVYERILREGHLLANHTYSHRIRTGLYRSTSSFIEDVEKLDRFICDEFGLPTNNVVRFPGGSYQAFSLRRPIIDSLHSMGYQYVDWTGSTHDSSDSCLTVDSAFFNATLDCDHDIDVLLMHDFSKISLAALPRIITDFRERNYTFFPLVKESHVMGR